MLTSSNFCISRLNQSLLCFRSFTNVFVSITVFQRAEIKRVLACMHAFLPNNAVEKLLLVAWLPRDDLFLPQLLFISAFFLATYTWSKCIFTDSLGKQQPCFTWEDTTSNHANQKKVKLLVTCFFRSLYRRFYSCCCSSPAPFWTRRSQLQFPKTWLWQSPRSYYLWMERGHRLTKYIFDHRRLWWNLSGDAVTRSDP